MNCPKCQAPNADDALFCSNCGAPMEQPAAPTNDLPVYGADNAASQPAAQPQQPAANPYSSMPVYGAGQSLYAPNGGSAAPSYNSTAYTPGGYYAVPKPGDAGKDWAAITALVCGILSIPCCLAYGAGTIIGIAAIVFGIIGIKSTKKGMAIAGLICGVLGLLFGVFMLIGLIGIFQSPEFMQEYQSMLDQFSTSL